MKKAGDICVITDLEVGQIAKIKLIKEKDKRIKRHLLDMGIVRETKIKINRVAPMGDPINILLRDYELCISKKDLSKIEVEVIK